MGDEVFPEDARIERGLSRRKLIQRAAVVGAAAWSAPVIIDSLASSAFGAVPSGCKPYWVKLRPSGNCFDASPASGPGKDCDGNNLAVNFTFPLANPAATELCATGTETMANWCDSSCTGGHDKKVTVSTSGAYTQVNLPSGCKFDSLISALAGRYDQGGETRFTQTCAGASAAGNGRYVNGGTTGWVKSVVDFGSGDLDDMPLDYIYVQFCCS